MKPMAYVVDDNEAVRQSICSLLEELLQLDVESYSNGQDFLEAFEPRSNTCLILDRRMPGLCGDDVMSHLQQTGISIPTILMSGHADEVSNQLAWSENVVATVAKPFRGSEFVDIVRKALI